ncbi:hypothetical protein [Anaerocolumna aminovalerica]|uniref:hypothetical protein n=1 Tax=Anaerocolumna aminovalerica TaxID=1527 RepID=UPI001C0E9F19|nr:hypothetical protein [Anaerocolumna aminovalerica]MBU5332401.1 hypothetical protein [Anaerocolumna aminovalerica]
MKRSKVLACIMVVVMTISTLIPISAKAQTTKNEGVEVNLGEFYMLLPDYKEDEVNVQTEGSSVNIIDQKTGVVLETITCTSIPKDSPKLNSIIPQNETLAGDTSYYAITRDQNNWISTVRLEVMVVLYHSGSFASVQSIEGISMYLTKAQINTQIDQNSKSMYARSVSGSFPSTEIEYYGSCQVVTTTTIVSGETLNVGFSISQLLSQGLNVIQSSTSSNTYYVYTPSKIHGTFYTYSQHH